jgi:hypothetical protein
MNSQGDTLQRVPDKYRKLSVSRASSLLGKNRTTFIRNHVSTNDQAKKLSKKQDEQGNDYIPLSELVRVFGLETVLQSIERLESEQVGDRDHEHLATGEQVFTNRGDTQRTGTEQLETIKELLTLQGELKARDVLIEQLKEQLKLKDQVLEAKETTIRLLETKQEPLFMASENSSEADKQKGPFHFLRRFLGLLG